MVKRRGFRLSDLKNEDITDLFFGNNTYTRFVEYMRRYFVAMQIHPNFIIPLLHAAYPSIHLGERVCKKMVGVLSGSVERQT
jgi:hypothetical protein